MVELLARWLARERACAPSTCANYEQHVRRECLDHVVVRGEWGCVG